MYVRALTGYTHQIKSLKISVRFLQQDRLMENVLDDIIHFCCVEVLSELQQVVSSCFCLCSWHLQKENNNTSKFDLITK